MSKIFEAVKSALVGNITKLDRPLYAGELHSYLYKDQSAGIHTPLSMFMCIMGYELLQSIYGDTEYFADKWGKQLSDDDLADMLTLAEKWFNENPEGLQEIWENLEVS